MNGGIALTMQAPGGSWIHGNITEDFAGLNGGV